MAEAAQTLRLQVDVLDPPQLAPDAPVQFGLQDKNGSLTLGAPQPNGSLRFECALQVRLGGATPNFLGAYAHGTPQDRFLYLTWKNTHSDQIIQRIKVKLASITVAQVAAALQSGKRLCASIEATHTGSVPLLDGGWQPAE